MGLLREHVPRLEGLTQFEFDSVRRDRTNLRKAKLQMGIKPLVLEVVP